jgi:membrane-bound lytic murein transglycosylase D
MSRRPRLLHIRVTTPLVLALAGIGEAQAPSLHPIVEHAALPPPGGTMLDVPPAVDHPTDSLPLSSVQNPQPVQHSAPDLLEVDRAGTDRLAAGPGRGPASADPLSSYPVVRNERTQHFLGRYTGSRRQVIEAWFERAGRHLGMVRETLRRFGLPEDLAFTAMIESGFNPVAVSRAGAKGLWQLMAETARRYGLRVDRWVDERLDPEKSTIAAAAYFRDLYRQFGSWFLAQAAYNTGETRLARAMQRARTTDFWVLADGGHLHEETSDFVPAIQAITLIGRNPDQYGFELSLTNPSHHETMRVPPSTDLRRLAAAAGVSPGLLEELNPELVRQVTPPGGPYVLRVPPGTEADLRRVVARPRGDRRLAPGQVTSRAGLPAPMVYVVRRDDTVRQIAARYGVTVADIGRWNPQRDLDRIRPGDRIRIASSRLAVPQRLAAVPASSSE